MEHDTFYESAYIERNALQATDDCRHGFTCHMVLVICVWDFHDQALETLPDGTPTSSTKGLAFQFQAKNPFHESAAQYTGHLKVRFMVQARQMNHEQVD